MTTREHVVLMLGGSSAEREVSLRSGAAVAAALEARGYRVTRLDPQNDSWVLPADVDVVFLALHGTYGEDGTVQRRLDALNVAYTGCDAGSSVLAFDKVLSKERFVAAGVPTPAGCVVGSVDAPWPAGLRGPLVVKPVCQGSSVGLGFVDDAAGWAGALAGALAHDGRALVEERVVGRELTVGILGGNALPVVEVRPKTGGYDYANKYTAGATEYLCPAPLDDEVGLEVQQAAVAAFQALGCRDYARVDVMLDLCERPWVLEVNTLPGMTETSLLPKAATAAGIHFGGLCERMLEMALARRPALEASHVG